MKFTLSEYFYSKGEGSFLYIGNLGIYQFILNDELDKEVEITGKDLKKLRNLIDKELGVRKNETKSDVE